MCLGFQSWLRQRELANLSKSQMNKTDASKLTNIENHNHDSQDHRCLTLDCCWWEPPMESLPLDFCRDTSLHGLKYIGQSKRHLIERIFWSVAFISGLVVATYLISDVWRKYNENPVIVSFQPFETRVDQIPFPAVTICNMNKVLSSKAEEYIQMSQGREELQETEDAKEDVFYLEHICSASKSFSKKFNFSSGRGEVPPASLFDSIKMNASKLTDVKGFLQKASQNCSDMVPLCMWQDEIINCLELFKAIETDFGKCCTFNMVPQTLLHRFRNDSRDNPDEVAHWLMWDLDKDGLLINSDPAKQIFPRRQMRAGKTFGLSILLNPALNEYFCTTSDSEGFRMATHLPIDAPHVVDFGIGIQPKSEVFIDIKSEITMMDRDILGFSLEKRQCYFSGEFQLKYYAYYTPTNCIDECVANATFLECNCVRYYMPRDEKQQLCGPSKFQCAESVKNQIIRGGLKHSCKTCLPTCTEMQYVMDTTVTPLQSNVNLWKYGGRSANWAGSNVSIVHIFMGQDSTYARVRKELFGTTDLFANTGGLMGLCLGFSGLSLMEVIYFLTLRAWCRNRRKRHVFTKITKKFQTLWARTKVVRKYRQDSKNADPLPTKVMVSSLSSVPETEYHHLPIINETNIPCSITRNFYCDCTNSENTMKDNSIWNGF